MSGFSKREEGFESKFAFDAEKRFKAEARRNKHLAEWFGGKTKLDAAGVDAYAKELIAHDLKKAGDDDVVAKLSADLKAKGVVISDKEIRAEMERCLRTAYDAVANGT